VRHRTTAAADAGRFKRIYFGERGALARGEGEASETLDLGYANLVGFEGAKRGGFVKTEATYDVALIKQESRG
jgi:hypothetical protein